MDGRRRASRRAGPRVPQHITGVVRRAGAGSCRDERCTIADRRPGGTDDPLPLTAHARAGGWRHILRGRRRPHHTRSFLVGARGLDPAEPTSSRLHGSCMRHGPEGRPHRSPCTRGAVHPRGGSLRPGARRDGRSRRSRPRWRCLSGRPLASAVAAIIAANDRAAGFRPDRRYEAATWPKARAAAASNGSGSKSASACWRVPRRRARSRSSLATRGPTESSARVTVEIRATSGSTAGSVSEGRARPTIVWSSPSGTLTSPGR